MYLWHWQSVLLGTDPTWILLPRAEFLWSGDTVTKAPKETAEEAAPEGGHMVCEITWQVADFRSRWHQNFRFLWGEHGGNLSILRIRSKLKHIKTCHKSTRGTILFMFVRGWPPKQWCSIVAKTLPGSSGFAGTSGMGEAAELAGSTSCWWFILVYHVNLNMKSWGTLNIS